MRNSGWAAAALIGTALAVTACGPSSYSAGSSGARHTGGGAYGTPTGSSSASTSGTAAQTSALKVTRTSAGTVLASSRGLTLYYYTEDEPGSGKSACTGSCASAWPPLAAPVRAPAASICPARSG